MASTQPKIPEASSRERLLEACERLVLSEGVSAVTARRLASEARVNLSMTSYNFGGIEGLVAEVAMTNFELSAQRALDAIAAGEGEPGERLKTIIEEVLRSLWTPSIHSSAGRATSVVELIYAQASDATRSRIAAGTRERFILLVDLLAPLLPGLSREELMFRLTCIGSAIRSAGPRNSAWDVYFAMTGTDPAQADLVDPVTRFALAALAR